MRAHTITTNNRPKPSAGRRLAAVALATGALAVPAMANASPIGSSGGSGDSSGYSSVSSITGAPASSSDGSAVSDTGYSSLSSITGAPASSSDGSAVSDSGYSSLSSITGPPASEPTLVSGRPGDPVDRFDWGSAAIGAGTVLALGALSAATLLTVRRRTTATPSVSTS
jgi:hypothetical protein